MNGTADASIDLELNAKQLYSELKSAESKYREGMDRIGQSVNRAGAAHDGFTVKTRAAGRQIHNFAQDLVSGADSATLFSDGLMGIGKSLNLSLGALAAGGIGAVLISNIYTAVEAAKQLKKDIQKIGADDGNVQFEALDTLIAKLEVIKKKAEDLNAQHKKNIGYLSSSGPAVASSIAAENADFQKQNDQSNASARITRGEIAARAGRANDISQMSPAMQKVENLVSGFHDKINETQTPGSPKENQLLGDQIRKQLAIELGELLHSIIEKADNSSRLSLGELASHSPDGTDREYSNNIQAVYAGQQARQVQDLDKQANRESLLQNFDRAKEIRSRAEEIRNSIGGLKTEEKTSVFKDALDASVRLANIDKNTANPPRLTGKP